MAIGRHRRCVLFSNYFQCCCRRLFQHRTNRQWYFCDSFAVAFTQHSFEINSIHTGRLHNHFVLTFIYPFGFVQLIVQIFFIIIFFRRIYWYAGSEIDERIQFAAIFSFLNSIRFSFPIEILEHGMCLRGRQEQPYSPRNPSRLHRRMFCNVYWSELLSRRGNFISQDFHWVTLHLYRLLFSNGLHVVGCVG